MRASDYLPLAICAAPQEDLGTPADNEPIQCFRSRVPELKSILELDDKGNPKLPLVLWRIFPTEDGGRPEEDGQPRTRSRVHLTDGPSDALYRFFEMECRAMDGSGAEVLAQDILDYMRHRGLVTHILTEQDEQDDTGQKRGEYHSHVVVFGLFAEIPNARGCEALADFQAKYERAARDRLFNLLPSQVRSELGGCP